MRKELFADGLNIIFSSSWLLLGIWLVLQPDKLATFLSQKPPVDPESLPLRLQFFGIFLIVTGPFVMMAVASANKDRRTPVAVAEGNVPRQLFVDFSLSIMVLVSVFIGSGLLAFICTLLLAFVGLGQHHSDLWFLGIWTTVIGISCLALTAFSPALQEWSSRHRKIVIDDTGLRLWKYREVMRWPDIQQIECYKGMITGTWQHRRFNIGGGIFSMTSGCGIFSISSGFRDHDGYRWMQDSLYEVITAYWLRNRNASEKE
jgi:hypothetical protein